MNLRSEKYEMADAIMNNQLGVAFLELRLAKALPTKDEARVTFARERFDEIYKRRQALFQADENTLQAVIDSLGPPVRTAILSLND